MTGSGSARLTPISPTSFPTLAKSPGLATYRGSAVLAAVAAIIRSAALRRGWRPAVRTDAQIRP
jgi:hypothetical protein